MAQGRSQHRLSRAVAIGLSLTLAAAWATGGEGTLRLEVLRAEAQGASLDVLLRIEAPAGEAEELGPDDFAVFIAPTDLPASEAAAEKFRVRRIFLKRLGNSYFLDLRRLPPGAGAGACQLVVRVTRRGEQLASHHVAGFLDAPAEHLDVALLIDESYSMRETDPGRLRVEAAKTFVDLARRSPRIAHIAAMAFNEEARTLAPLTPPAEADALYQAIDKVRATGQTDMDGALALGMALLGKSSGPAKVALLLSDGKDEPQRYQEAHRAFAQRRWPVYTVGLSARADAETLARIASDTGGEFHQAPTSAQLQDIFGRICLALQKKVTIRSRSLRLAGGKPLEDPLAVDDTVSALTVRLDGRQPDIAFALADPAGRLLTPESVKDQRGAAYGCKANHQHYDLLEPGPGRWTSRLAAAKDAEATLAATAATTLLLRAFPVKTAPNRGEPIEIAVSLADRDAVLPGARVEARIEGPGGTGSPPVTLYDDGRHLDTASGDGVFAGVFPGADRPGQCAIVVVATGATAAGHPFERELRLTTTVQAEEVSKLWASASELDFGLLYSGERAERSFDLKLISPLPTPEDVQLRIADFGLPIEIRNPKSEIRNLEPGRTVPVTLAVRIPPGQAPGRFAGQLQLISKHDRLSLPLVAEVRHPKLVIDKTALDLGAIESGGKADAAFELRLEPRGALPARLTASDTRFALTPGTLDLTAKPSSVRVAFASPPGQATEQVKAKVVVEAPVGGASLPRAGHGGPAHILVEVPVALRVVRPSFAIAPAALDFGEVSPGQAVERQLTLSIQGLAPREAALSASPLIPSPPGRGQGEGAFPGVPALALDAPRKLEVKPDEPAAVQLRLRVPPAQPPGTYKGELVARTPLGEHKVSCTATVGAANTFQVAAALDFGQVAVGTTKELQAEVASLVDAEQKVELSVPVAGGTGVPPVADWQLAAEPAALTLPPRGKASVAFRLTASPSAKPGPRSAAVSFRGPSRGASLEARALIFRPPHASLAFDPPELDAGRLQAGIPEQFRVLVRSLVDEPQTVTIEPPAAPADLVAVHADPIRFDLSANPQSEIRNPKSDGSQPVVLTITPLAGPPEAPFEATLTARGRSLPATLRIRGMVFTPPRTTFVLLGPVLDFGPMTPGQRAELALCIQSVWQREQRVSLAGPPIGEGVELSAERSGALLLPGVMHPIGIEVSVATDATPGERRFAWEVRGPGDPATFEVRVEVVPHQAPAFGTSIGFLKPQYIWWLDGLALFLVLLLLLAIVAASYWLTRRLFRSPRVPRMTAYFVASTLVCCALMFLPTEAFYTLRTWGQEKGALVGVGLTAAGSGDFSSQLSSAADELRALAERERRLEAVRRQQEAARLARELLESERRKLDPTLARLEKPRAEERLDLTPREPEAKKLTLEDIAQVMEEIRAAAPPKEAAKPEASDAAPVLPTRVPDLRDLTREQLERLVRDAIQPKAAAVEKTAAPPDLPGLAEARATEKTTLAPDALIPAMEALKGELGRAEAVAKGPAVPAAGEVQASRAVQGPALERAPGPAERSAIAEAPRPTPDPGSAIADRRPAEPGLSEIRNPQSEIRNLQEAPLAADLPQEQVATPLGAGRAAPAPTAAPGSAAPSQAAAWRLESEASIERPGLGAARTAPTHAPRITPDLGHPVVDRASAEPGLSEIRNRQSEIRNPRPAPVSAATPAEHVSTDPLVELPGTPRRGGPELAPAAVAIAYHGAPVRGAERAAPAQAPASRAAEPRGTEPARVALERPAAAIGLPEPSPPAARPSARAAPGLDAVAVAEGPLVAARQAAPASGGKAGPQPVAAQRHPAPPGDARSALPPRVARAAAADQSAPRGVALERPAPDPLTRHASRVTLAQGPQATVPLPDAEIGETVGGGPRGAAPAAHASGPPAPRTTEGRRQESLAGIERAAPSSPGHASRITHHVPRPASPVPDRPVSDLVTRHASRVMPGQTPQTTAPIPEAPVAEAVSPGARTAAPSPRASELLGPRAIEGSREQPLADIERPALSSSGHASRVTHHAPRPTPPDSAQGRTGPRLLLPELAARGGQAGALVGDASGTAKTIVLTTAKYGGAEADWDVHRTAMPFLAWQLRERVGFNLETDVIDVPLASGKIMGSPWLFMTGHKDFRLADTEVANLRRYVLAGGTLWAEDCTHEDDPTWDRAFRREIARVFPPADGHKLRRITKDDGHPLFRSCFDLADGYKGYFPPPGDKFRQSYIEGIELDNRLAVIYTRNDYGCGLEIKPDTHPGKVSLSSLSPAEMQESSFLMASNIVIYALTGGRGTSDRGMAGRAAASLRRQRDAAQAQGDPYDKAPATLFDNFAEDRWAVETEWQQAAPANLRYMRRAAPVAGNGHPNADGKRLAVSYQLRKGDAKAVLIRDLPQEADLTGHERCYIDIESRLEGGARLALALITMPDWKYFESRPAFIKPGRQRVFFDLRAEAWKTGEPVPEGQSEYSRRPANLAAVRRFVLLLYPVQQAGSVILDQIEFRSKP